MTCDAGEKMAVLIPYTYHAGVFLILTKKQKEGTPDVNMDQQGIMNRNFQEGRYISGLFWKGNKVKVFTVF